MPIKSKLEVGAEAAEIVVRLIKEKPAACIGMPTGSTPLEMYRNLAKSDCDWRAVRCFALDDYLEIDEKNSFQSYLQSHLYQYVDIQENNKLNPRFCDDYDQLIADCGGLDLVVLGIGINGHIAFNEPGTPESSWTHSVFLTEETRNANRMHFDTADNIPRKGLTMGIQTILASNEILLMALGEEKENILARSLESEVSPSIPASFLQRHKRLTVLTDFALDYSNNSSSC